MKNLIHLLIHKLVNLKYGKIVLKKYGQNAMSFKKVILHNNIKYSFIVPNDLCDYRVLTFATKEPETLSWIDSFDDETIFWDIGANVGLYSIYAAKSKKSNVYAFEPSFFNLEILSRNIYLNALQSKITIVPIPLSNFTNTNTFQMTSTQWGGALSTFGANIDQNGKPIKEIFEYNIIGTTMDEIINNLNIPIPNFIKIDVDGIEHLILSGGKFILSNVKSVLIEIDDNFIEQSQKTEKLLTEAGLVLFKKCNIDSINQFNQWWIRPTTKSI
jgi:FkbM family methyltransferase